MQSTATGLKYLSRALPLKTGDPVIIFNGDYGARGLGTQILEGPKANKQTFASKYLSYELTKTSSLALSLQLFHSKLKTLLFSKSNPD